MNSTTGFQNRWFNRHPALSMCIVTVTLIVLVVVILELGLQLAGKKPSSRILRPVKTLIIQDKFYTDSEGFYHANPKSHPRRVGVNSAGFRGMELDAPDEGKPSVLMLGDSFLWGIGAKPLKNAFADQVEDAGYRVYNFGVPGIGPRHYSAYAKKYIPAIRPDMVAVFMFLGNDVNSLPDIMMPNKNLWHATNARMLYGFDIDGNPLSAQEAYEQAYGKYYYVSLFKYWLSRTNIGSKLLSGYSGTLRTISQPMSEYSDARHAIRFLGEIRGVSEATGAEFFVFLIPINPLLQGGQNSTEHFSRLLKDFDPIVPQYVTHDHYEALPGMHFNNEGHKRFAGLIVDTFKNNGTPPME